MTYAKSSQSEKENLSSNTFNKTATVAMAVMNALMPRGFSVDPSDSRWSQNPPKTHPGMGGQTRELCVVVDAGFLCAA